MTSKRKFLFYFFTKQYSFCVQRTLRQLGPLPDKKILALFQLKTLADNYGNVFVVHMVQFLVESVENIVGKGENDGSQNFFTFPTIYSNIFPRGHQMSSFYG